MPGDLRAAVERCGYYPNVVLHSLALAVGAEPVTSFLVHHEATFDRDELRRHLTVVILTPTRLVIGHTDDFPADDQGTPAHAATSTEAVRIERLNSVVISHVIDGPEHYDDETGLPRELVISVGWGAVSRLDLEPASCGDPDCEADHGYTGSSTVDDFSVRVSIAADGVEGVEQAVAFAHTLSRATTR
ncbi:MAG: DUF5998 family protein [Actinomycetes bacterium]